MPPHRPLEYVPIGGNNYLLRFLTNSLNGIIDDIVILVLIPESIFTGADLYHSSNANKVGSTSSFNHF